jgi:hypothetical protein
MNLERTALQLEDLSIIDEIGNIEKTDSVGTSHIEVIPLNPCKRISGMTG